MKLFQLLNEMPLKQIKKGTIRNVSSNKEYDEYTNFRTTDITVIDKKLADGSYHLALAKLPFDFYVYISDRKNKQNNEEGLSWAKTIFKKNPNSVIYLLQNNNSDNHIPLTPWMIIHRLIQEARSIIGFDYFDKHQVSQVLLKDLNSKLNKTKVLELIAACCQMKSANKKYMDPLEITVEIPTEIAITGKIRRNIEKGLSEFNLTDNNEIHKLLIIYFNLVEEKYIEYFKTVKGIYRTDYIKHTI